MLVGDGRIHHRYAQRHPPRFAPRNFSDDVKYVHWTETKWNLFGLMIPDTTSRHWYCRHPYRVPLTTTQRAGFTKQSSGRMENPVYLTCLTSTFVSNDVKYIQIYTICANLIKAVCIHIFTVYHSCSMHVTPPPIWGKYIHPCCTLQMSAKGTVCQHSLATILNISNVLQSPKTVLKQHSR